ncbi:MAG: DUF1217 domain-containing protein [Erythrobacter sp.]|jgi:hypothetical protein|nr:DUF1217 domain-containing protein [Erythrobacter sp.]
MSFQPVVPLPGLGGWRFLQRTIDTQQETFVRAPRISRDIAYFEAEIGKVRSAEALVGDRRLLTVALGAFGLQDDIQNRFFIRKVLEEGTLRPDALANKLTDPRYKDMAAAFGFGDFDVPRTALSDFGAEIVARYREQEFERAVGAQNESMRLALFAKRELAALAGSQESDNARWFRVMGTPPLRRVFETALGMPAAFGQLDIDRQLDEFRDRSRRVLGSAEVADFASEGARERLIQQFLLRGQDSTGQVPGPASIALTLLQNAAAARG